MKQHCVKSVRIRRFSGPYIPAFGLNTEYLSVFSPNAGNYRPEKHPIRTLLLQCKAVKSVLKAVRETHQKIATTDLVEVTLNEFVLKIKRKCRKFCVLKKSSGK